MRRKHGPSLYYMTDKNIYDVLQSRRVTLEALNNRLVDRGIFLSPDDDKDKVSEYFSSTVSDYFDYKFLSDLLENPNKKEPYTSSKIDIKLDNTEIKKSCDTLLDERKDKGEVLKVAQSGNLTVITATYTEVDFSKTELRQRTTKTATIEVERHSSGLVIRQQANDRAKDIASDLKKFISESTEEEIKETVISLEAFTQPEARSYFFDRLIKSVEGYEPDSVKHVDVNYSAEDNDEEESSDADYIGHIQKAVLNGEGVLQSAEFSQLHNTGFYITKITWTAKETLPAGDKVEFYAEFGDANNCTDYKYLVRYVYNYKEMGEYIKTGRAPSNTEKKELTRLLENATSAAYEAVVDKFGVGERDENSKVA